MKRVLVIIVVIFLFIPLNVSCNEYEGVEKILEMAGDLKDSYDPLGIDFNNIIAYIKDSFLFEFKNIFTKMPVLFLLLVLFSVKNCMDSESSINKTVSLALFSAAALLSAGIISDLFSVATQMITDLSAYIYVCIPILCGLVASGGLVITSAKATFIILSSMNIVTYLINIFFIPLVQIYFIFGVLSSLLENDLLKALKSNIKSIIKISLPSLVAIFVALLSIFMNVTKKMDDFSLKSAKLAVGNMIPFLGSALADSTELVVNSIGQIKAYTGFASILAMLYIFLIPMLKIISGILAFKLLSVTAGFLTDKAMTTYYEDLSAVLSILCGLMATITVMVIVSVVILMNL